MITSMKLATEIPWQGSQFSMPVERIKRSEDLGYDAVFSSEGWGSDGFTPLGYAAAITSRLALGTSIAQGTARSPAATAMAVQTLDAMTGGGRVILGLGVTRPYVAEGLHGIRWTDPVARMRDYVAIVRHGLRGESLEHAGASLSIPYRGEGSRASTAMRLLLPPAPDVPVLLAGSGPKMVSLAAEIAEGWLPRSFAPDMMPHAVPLLEEGFRRSDTPKSLTEFQVWAHVDAMVSDDVPAAMRHFKEYVARWAGSQRQQMVWCGQGEVCDRVEELMAADRLDDAIDAVPDDYIDHCWLVGPLSRIRRRVEPWLQSGVTGLIVRHGGPVAGVNSPAEDLEFFRAIADARG
jgi:F420-dependent oxidoreductase-like protein